MKRPGATPSTSPTSRSCRRTCPPSTQAAIATLGFETVTIAQPALLVGDRAALGQPVRSAEVWATRVFTPLRWMVPKGILPIKARDVAAALLAATLEGKPGVHLLGSGAMQP